MVYSSKPNFLIIGAQKAGTSALFSILSQHSMLVGASKKEIHYFDNDEWYMRKSLFEYHSFFPLPHDTSANSKLFEATPMYLYHPDVAKRLYDYNPNLRLIIILRAPEQRALSAWTMYHHHFKDGEFRHLHDNRSFFEAITEELSNEKREVFNENKVGYVQRGFYHYQIKKYLKYFDRSQILFLESNEIKEQFDNSMEVITSFLNVHNESLELKIHNRSRLDNKNLYEKEIEMLKEIYYPDNIKLFNLLGTIYNWND